MIYINSLNNTKTKHNLDNIYNITTVEENGKKYVIMQIENVTLSEVGTYGCIVEGDTHISLAKVFLMG